MASFAELPDRGTLANRGWQGVYHLELAHAKYAEPCVPGAMRKAAVTPLSPPY